MKDWIVFRIAFTWAKLFCNLFYQWKKREMKTCVSNVDNTLRGVLFWMLRFVSQKWHKRKMPLFIWMNLSILHRFIALWARPWTGMNRTRNYKIKMEANRSRKCTVYTAPLVAFEFSIVSFFMKSFFCFHCSLFIVQFSSFVIDELCLVLIIHSCNTFPCTFFYCNKKERTQHSGVISLANNCLQFIY